MKNLAMPFAILLGLVIYGSTPALAQPKGPSGGDYKGDRKLIAPKSPSTKSYYEITRFYKNKKVTYYQDDSGAIYQKNGTRYERLSASVSSEFYYSPSYRTIGGKEVPVKEDNGRMFFRSESEKSWKALPQPATNRELAVTPKEIKSKSFNRQIEVINGKPELVYSDSKTGHGSVIRKNNAGQEVAVPATSRALSRFDEQLKATKGKPAEITKGQPGASRSTASVAPKKDGKILTKQAIADMSPKKQNDIAGLATRQNLKENTKD